MFGVVHDLLHFMKYPLSESAAEAPEQSQPFFFSSLCLFKLLVLMLLIQQITANEIKLDKN